MRISISLTVNWLDKCKASLSVVDSALTFPWRPLMQMISFHLHLLSFATLAGYRFLLVNFANLLCINETALLREPVPVPQFIFSTHIWTWKLINIANPLTGSTICCLVKMEIQFSFSRCLLCMLSQVCLKRYFFAIFFALSHIVCVFI